MEEAATGCGPATVRAGCCLLLERDWTPAAAAAAAGGEAGAAASAAGGLAGAAASGVAVETEQRCGQTTKLPIHKQIEPPRGRTGERPRGHGRKPRGRTGRSLEGTGEGPRGHGG